MFNFRMPNVNIGRSLSQINPMHMMGQPLHTIQDAFGAARNISPLTQAMGMVQRHPNQQPNLNMNQMVGQQPHMDFAQAQQALQQRLAQRQQMGPSPMQNPNMAMKTGINPIGRGVSQLGNQLGMSPQSHNPYDQFNALKKML